MCGCHSNTKLPRTMLVSKVGEGVKQNQALSLWWGCSGVWGDRLDTPAFFPPPSLRAKGVSHEGWLAEGSHSGARGPRCSGMRASVSAPCQGPVPPSLQGQRHPRAAWTGCPLLLLSPVLGLPVGAYAHKPGHGHEHSLAYPLSPVGRIQGHRVSPRVPTKAARRRVWGRFFHSQAYHAVYLAPFSQPRIKWSQPNELPSRSVPT